MVPLPKGSRIDRIVFQATIFRGELLVSQAAGRIQAISATFIPVYPGFLRVPGCPRGGGVPREP